MYEDDGNYFVRAAKYTNFYIRRTKGTAWGIYFNRILYEKCSTREEAKYRIKAYRCEGIDENVDTKQRV